MDADKAISLLVNQVLLWPYWKETGELNDCLTFAAEDIAITEYQDRLFNSEMEWCLGVSFTFERSEFVCSFGMSEQYRSGDRRPLLEATLTVDAKEYATALFRHEDDGKKALVSLQTIYHDIDPVRPAEHKLTRVGEQILLTAACQEVGHLPRWLPH